MPNAYTRSSVVTLTEVERAELMSMARSRSLPAALAQRARIVLACEGRDTASTEVAKALGIDRGTVNKWRGRYARERISGLYDELRPGRYLKAFQLKPHRVESFKLSTDPLFIEGVTHDYVLNFLRPIDKAVAEELQVPCIADIWPSGEAAVAPHSRTFRC